MERKDFIKLIKAAEGVMILENACKVSLMVGRPPS